MPISFFAYTKNRSIAIAVTIDSPDEDLPKGPRARVDRLRALPKGERIDLTMAIEEKCHWKNADPGSLVHSLKALYLMDATVRHTRERGERWGRVTPPGTYLSYLEPSVRPWEEHRKDFEWRYFKVGNEELEDIFAKEWQSASYNELTLGFKKVPVRGAKEKCKGSKPRGFDFSAV